MSKKKQMKEYCEATVRKLYRDRDELLKALKYVYDHAEGDSAQMWKIVEEAITNAERP